MRDRSELGGRMNRMAVTKAVILVVLVAVSSNMNALTPLPDFPQLWLAKQWTKDTIEYLNNTTIWYELGPRSKNLHLVIPMFYGIVIMLWAVFIRRLRRKVLYVNGVRFGTVMWIYGFRGGHIYDLACLTHNGGRHFEDMAEFPRPISMDFMAGRTIIYYRPFLIHHPLMWYRLVVDDATVFPYGVQVRVPVSDSGPLNVYSHRLTDPVRPMLVYSDLRGSTMLAHELMDMDKLMEAHVATQENMIKNTWRMGRAEPGTALSILSKASYSIPDRTLGRFWEKLPESDRDKIREAWSDGSQGG